MQCAGNRRTAMSKTRTVKGVGWDVAALGNGNVYFHAFKCNVCHYLETLRYSYSRPLL